MRVCRAMGSVKTTAFHLPICCVSHSEALLWIQMWRDPGKRKGLSTSLYVKSRGHACTHTEHMVALSPEKDPCSIQNWNVLPSLSPPPSSVLVLHFSRRTQSRTVRHDTWDHVGIDAPLFPPGFTSFFPSLVGTFSTGSKPTGRLVCVHVVVHKTLATEPSASGNRTKGLVYSVPGVSSSIPDSHAFSIFTKCST